MEKTQLQVTGVGMRSVTGTDRTLNCDYANLWRDVSGSSENLFILASGVCAADAAMQPGSLNLGEFIGEEIIAAYRDSTEGDAEMRLVQAVAAANANLYDMAMEDPDIDELSGSVCAAVVYTTDAGGCEMVIATVGSNRLSLVRDGRAQHITQDHTLIAQLIADGTLTESEARVHPRRYFLTRRLGVDRKVQIDAFSGKLRAGDSILFCSDGLHLAIFDGQIAEVVQVNETAQAAADNLVDAAHLTGMEDDITALVVEISEQTVPVVGVMPESEGSAADESELEPAASRLGEILGILRARMVEGWAYVQKRPFILAGAGAFVVVLIAALLLIALLGRQADSPDETPSLITPTALEMGQATPTSDLLPPSDTPKPSTPTVTLTPQVTETPEPWRAGLLLTFDPDRSVDYFLREDPDSTRGGFHRYAVVGADEDVTLEIVAGPYPGPEGQIWWQVQIMDDAQNRGGWVEQKVLVPLPPEDTE